MTAREVKAADLVHGSSSSSSNLPFEALVASVFEAAKLTTVITSLQVLSKYELAFSQKWSVLSKLTTLLTKNVYTPFCLVAAHIPSVTFLDLGDHGNIDRPPDSLQRLRLQVTQATRRLLDQIATLRHPVELVISGLTCLWDLQYLPSITTFLWLEVDLESYLHQHQSGDIYDASDVAVATFNRLQNLRTLVLYSFLSADVNALLIGSTMPLGTVFGFGLAIRKSHCSDLANSNNRDWFISFPPNVRGLHSVFPNLRVLEVHDPYWCVPTLLHRSISQDDTHGYYFDVSWIDPELFSHLVGITSRCYRFGFIHFQNCASKTNVVTH